MLEHRDPDVLAPWMVLAGMDGGEDTGEREQSRAVVADRGADPDRAAADLAGHAHEAGDALHDDVVRGPRRPWTGVAKGEIEQ